MKLLASSTSDFYVTVSYRLSASTTVSHKLSASITNVKC